MLAPLVGGLQRIKSLSTFFPWKKYTLEENEENLEVYSEAKEREPGIKVR